MSVLRDYRCTECATVSEHWDNTDELAPRRCPDCGGSKLTSMIGAPNLAYTDMACNGEASSDAMNTAISKWDKMRRQRMRTEKRNLERHGTVD